MKDENKKMGKFRNFIKCFDIPAVVTGGCGSIELIGDKRVIVENAVRILTYDYETVRLEAENRTVVIKGASLTLNSFSDNIMIVDGTISNVSLEK